MDPVTIILIIVVCILGIALGVAIPVFVHQIRTLRRYICQVEAAQNQRCVSLGDRVSELESHLCFIEVKPTKTILLETKGE